MSDNFEVRLLPIGQTSKRLISSYVFDWVIIMFVHLYLLKIHYPLLNLMPSFVSAVGGVLYKITGYKHAFSTTRQYPIR